MMMSNSFATRRQAVSGLPAFSLPPASAATEIVSRATGDGLSPSSGANTGSSLSSQAAGGAFYGHAHGQWQTPGGTHPYAYASSALANPAQTSAIQPPFNQGRPLYSPVGAYNHRSSQSPATAEGPFPAQDVAAFQSAIRESSGGGGGGDGGGGDGGGGGGGVGGGVGGGSDHPSSLVAASHQNSAASMPHLNSMLGSQGPDSHAPATMMNAPIVSTGEYRTPPTPAYTHYPTSSASSTSSSGTVALGQQSYATFHPQPSPPQSLSPLSSGAAAAAAAAVASRGGLTGMAPPMGYGPATPRTAGGFGGYHPMPPGAVMSNINNPGHRMSLVGGMAGMSMPPGYPGGPGPGGGSPTGHGGHPHPHQHQHQHPHQPQHPHQHHPQHPSSAASHMYGGSSGAGNHQRPVSTQERPFKCDLCPQAFTRNHDLKRHQRIHAPVKPFACNYCGKTFSRKDALKRHRLVKGCAEKAAAGENANAENTVSVQAAVAAVNAAAAAAKMKDGVGYDKTDVVSDGTDVSPRPIKVERMT